MLTDHRRRKREREWGLCSYAETLYWRRRARIYRLLFWLAVLVAMLIWRQR